MLARIAKHTEGSCTGNAWEPGDDVYFPFVVDLVSRVATGGTYPSGRTTGGLS